ncbi:ABC transporter permease [Muricomes sp. OA1]|uniref:ABC transporter permease n=1 Tax=Hungatella hathewayi TaxID=154046 RepID=A0A3E2WJQ5_9FIRM|nr:MULTISPECIES: ABC transporter permease [Clostridia]MCH1972064.1 ABC transporter permease [Muricomes sp. OA1]RGC27265.1 ABC transporter permease [Hungatella hathewayi]GKH30867.1 ABC transporter permease [Faecalicatena contorta]
MSRKSSGKIAVNNNGRTVRSLAASSIKSSKMRNFFIVVTIILSVSLLMVMALFYAGMDTERARQVEKMQHVIYYKLDRQQLEELSQDKRTEYVLGMKSGQGMEVDGKMIQPVAYDSEPLKADGVEIDTVTPVKGKEPLEINEVMLSDVHCKALGLQGEPGEKVSFTFLDGTTEEFVLSGIFHLDSPPKIYSLILSQKYAEQGSQLKDVAYDGIVRIHDAREMKQQKFLDTIRTMASDYGIARKNVNENNFYLDTLSGGDRQAQQNMLIIGVAIGILFVSVLVIYSVFYLSVVGRIRQFGQLRTIGMTKRQIRRMVRTEGLILCGIGIPVGLVIGGVISYLLKPGGWSWRNTLLVGAAVIVADIITVLLSIRKPAFIASSIAPVEASKFSGVETEKPKKGKKNRHAEGRRQDGAHSDRSKKMYRNLTPMNLASMNRTRNKKKTAMTMASLGIGGVLFMLAACFITCTSLEGYASQGPYRLGEFVIDLSYNVSETAEHGQTSIQENNPINEELIRQLESIDGVEKVQTFQELHTRWESHDEMDEESMVSFAENEVEKLKTMLEEGDINYDSMVQEDQLLVQYNDSNKEIFGWKYEVGDKVKLSWYDGANELEKEFTVAGILDTDDYIKYSNNYGNFILPEETLNQMANGLNLNSEIVVKVDREKEAQIEKQLNAVMDENPMLTMGTLREMLEESEKSFSILFSVMLGLSLFIVAFSILNMINTLITNILTRKHEFAMMQSVGMTTKQLSRMIQMEGLMLTAGNLVITLVFGTAAGYGMVKIFEYFGIDYMSFRFPGWLFLGYAVFTAIIPMIVSAVMIRGFQKEALVDRLRE